MNKQILTIPYKQRELAIYGSTTAFTSVSDRSIGITRSYDFDHERTQNGLAFRKLNVIDEYSRECLMIGLKRKLNSVDTIEVLADLFILRGVAGLHPLRQ